MLDHERALSAFLLDYAGKLVADVPDGTMAAFPTGVPMNHPAWILGHLALASDYGLALLGRPALAEPAWGARFGPGSELHNDAELYPHKEALWAAFARGHRALGEAVAEADPAALARPHKVPMQFLQEAFPTTGALLAHLRTTHLAVHLGQLSAWRRAMGFAGVLGA